MPETITTPEQTTPVSTDTRAALIARVASAHNLDDGWRTRMADAEDEISDDEIRADGRRMAVAAMQTRTAPVIRTHAPANDDPAVQMTRRADALFARTAGVPPAKRQGHLCRTVCAIMRGPL